MGAGNFSVHIGSFDLGGIGTATLTAIILNLFLNRGEKPSGAVQTESDESIKSFTHSA
jgi:xanthine/uracil permease